MSTDYIRCYINGININTLKNIQIESGEFGEWELMEGKDFDRKSSFGYKEGVLERDTTLLDAFALRSVIAETRIPKTTPQSMIWNNALNIADVLTILSFASARYISATIIEKEKDSTYTISRAVLTPLIDGPWDIVSLEKLGGFVSHAMNFLRSNPRWMEESGFKPVVYWFNQAQIAGFNAPTALEIGLNWVCMEILGSVHNQTHQVGLRYKKEIVKRYINDVGFSGKEWLFLDEIIDDWYAIRNGVFHEGEQRFGSDVMLKRKQQVRDFTSLVLVEMFQTLDKERREEIVQRIQSY